jgi:hypothetical protein
MNFLKIFLSGKRTIRSNAKERSRGFERVTEFDDDDIFSDTVRPCDSYLLNAWVHIAVGILMRNVARASFVLVKDGEEIGAGFTRPTGNLSLSFGMN